MNIKNKIQEKSGVGMIGLIVSLTIFSAILVGFTTWYINLNNNVAITGERMEEMSIAYDRWNQIINEDFDSLKERVDKISGRTESKLISNKYDLTIAYGSEGKFINGECVDGQAADDEQRCIPVSISVKNRNAIAGVASKPYSLSTTRVASQGSSNNGMPIGSVIWLSITTIPDGYLECNGQTVNSALYPKLAKFMSTTPNLSGKFIRARSAWEGLGAMTDYTAITLNFDNSFSHGGGLLYDWGYEPATTYIAGVARGADGHYINYPIVGEKTFVGQFTPMHMA